MVKLKRISFLLAIVAAFLLSCTPEAAGGSSGGDGGGDGGGNGGGSGTVSDTKNCTVSKCGELKRSGNKVVGLKTGDNVVQVRGVSMGWSNAASSTNGWESSFYFNANAVAAMKNWGANIVRAPLGVEGWQGYTSGGDKNLMKTKVKTVVDAAIANDMYVIIDWHAHDEAITKQADAISFFTEMVNLYGDSPNVIWEVFNEPIDVTWEQVKNFANQIIPVIREKSDNLILVGSPNWTQQPNKAINNEVADNNTAYTFHFYAANHSFTTLSRNVTSALNANLPVFVSEFGTVNADGAGAHDGAKSDIWLNFLDENKISWCAWQLSHKNEASAFFTKNISSQGVDAYNNTANLKPTAQYIKNRLAQ